MFNIIPKLFSIVQNQGTILPYMHCAKGHHILPWYRENGGSTNLCRLLAKSLERTGTAAHSAETGRTTWGRGPYLEGTEQRVRAGIPVRRVVVACNNDLGAVI